MSESKVEIRAELPGSWWYFAGMVRAVIKRNGWAWINRPDPNGCVLRIGPRDNPIAHIMFTSRKAGDDSETVVSVLTTANRESEFRPIVDELKAAAREAREARRSSVGATFREILDDYYARKARGERVKLKDLADSVGVNYHSLRQAKIRYDATRQEDD